MGMAPLASWLSNSGIDIFGYDDALQERSREFLVASGVQLLEFIFPEHLDSYQMIVYSSAITPTHTILQAAQAKEYPNNTAWRNAREGKSAKRLIAVVGSHGKTTTSGMIAHILRQASLPGKFYSRRSFNEPSLQPSNYSSSDWLIAED